MALKRSDQIHIEKQNKIEFNKGNCAEIYEWITGYKFKKKKKNDTIKMYFSPQ